MYRLFEMRTSVKHGTIERIGKARKNMLRIFGDKRDFFSTAAVSTYAVVKDSQMTDHDDRYSMYHLPQEFSPLFSVRVEFD